MLKVLTIKQAAALLDISEQAVRSLRRRGLLEAAEVQGVTERSVIVRLNAGKLRGGRPKKGG